MSRPKNSRSGTSSGAVPITSAVRQGSSFSANSRKTYGAGAGTNVAAAISRFRRS